MLIYNKINIKHSPHCGGYFVICSCKSTEYKKHDKFPSCFLYYILGYEGILMFCFL